MSSQDPRSKAVQTPPLKRADVGTHAELLAQGGLYAKLYDEQFRLTPEVA